MPFIPHYPSMFVVGIALQVVTIRVGMVAVIVPACTPVGEYCGTVSILRIVVTVTGAKL